MLWHAIIVIAALSPALLSQDTVARSSAPLNALPDEGMPRDYRMGAGDLLAVSVFGATDLDRVVRVSSSGTITLPLLGRLAVAGLTAEEAEIRISAMLAEQKLVREPQVAVFVKEYSSQSVYVLGAVNQPGRYAGSHQLRLVDALTMAGGLDAKKAGDTILLQRRKGKSLAERSASDENARTATSEVIKIDVRALLEKGDQSLNVVLQAGDVVEVPERSIDLFYVVGEVGRPGAYEFPRDSKKPLLVSQALVWAGGPMRTARTARGVLVRYDEHGTRQQLFVDFRAIMAGKKPDIEVRPNDVVFFPGSTTKTLGYGLLGVIPSTVSGAVIYRPPY